MRVLLVNTSERTGGAAVACRRLQQALRRQGVEAVMVVRDKQTDDAGVLSVKNLLSRPRFLWERFCIWVANRFSRCNLFAVDVANAGHDITGLPAFRQADVIHLHWVNQGFLSLSDIGRILASGKPVVWTMHDMWPFTGICHHARTCEAYRSACGQCPYLARPSAGDLSARVFCHKARLLQGHRMAFVACSRWLQSLAAQASLLQSQMLCCIPNPLDTSVFCPRDKQEARQRLGLPAGKTLILFGSVNVADKRKGADYLVEACALLAAANPALAERLGVVVVGNHSDSLSWPFSVYPLSFVSTDQGMADIYNAVDVYVTPSLEENLPNTIMEAMACGVPCVGFDVGGIPEMIDHLQNGYVARYKSAQDLADGIAWVCVHTAPMDLPQKAVDKARACYDQDRVAVQYIELYQKMCTQNG